MGLISPDKIRFILIAINLLILYFIMKRVLFKPVTEFMEKRTNSIKDSIENAEKNKAEASELKQKYSDQLKTAKDEADKILSNARDRASKEYEEIVADARRDAEAILQKAREEIDRERAQMVKGIKDQVSSIALAAATKVMEANMDTEANRVLVDKFIDEVGAA